MSSFHDIVIIGAGPAGASAASLLTSFGHKVLIIEKSHFPRFSIGESLLPQNMGLLEEAHLLSVFEKGNFKFKDGAEFLLGEKRKHIDFNNKSSVGTSTTFQVVRSEFDDLVIKEVIKKGTEVYFGHEITEVNFKDNDDYPVKLKIKDENDLQRDLQAKFIIDASGLAKVLPKLLNHKIEYTNQKRTAFFNHIKTKTHCDFNNDRILITVDETNRQNWFWTIPLKENYYSFGLITDEDMSSYSQEEVLNHFIQRNPELKRTLGDFEFQFETKALKGYTAKSTQIYGDHFVLIGNSGEFLDPIFSSGVTLALKSANLAAKVIHNKLTSQDFSWENDYSKEFLRGLETFQAFVEAWYKIDLQDIIFAKKMNTKIESMIISILAGYVWDQENSYTQNTKRRLAALSEICREET